MEHETDPAADFEHRSAVASTGPDDARRVGPTPQRRRRAFSLLAVVLVVLAADQLSKNWVVENLTEGRTEPVLGEFLQWHFVRNPGAAFSFATGATWVFTVLATVVVGFILWQLRRLGSRSWALFFALLLGGVLGNLTDRLTRDPGFPVGHVIDFILTPWMWPWMNPAIYNVADIAIVSAMILFVVISLLGLPIDGGPRHRAGARGSRGSGFEETGGESPDSSDPSDLADSSGGSEAAGAEDTTSPSAER